MRQVVAHEEVDIPATVKVQIVGRTVTVKGPRGTLVKNFNHVKVELSKVNHHKTIRAEVWFGNRAGLAVCRTVISHIRNMMTGVTRGFLYKMKVVYNHFPMTVDAEGNQLSIRNFIGDKRVRVVTLADGVSFERPKDSKDEIILSGNDVDAVAQTCSDIHISTLVKGTMDIRKFLDGIYVSYRGNVVEEF